MKTIKNGDYFELFEKDNEEWEWIIELGGPEQYLGYWNVESYMSIDEDEDYKAIGVGETISLPNDFGIIKFKSVTEPDRTTITFKVKDDYLYVRASQDEAFHFGTKDYDRLYIDSNGIYDKDKVLITNTKVEIGDSGIYLEMGSEVYSTWGVYIGDLFIELDMSDILYDGVSFATVEEIIMDHEGIIFKDPENAVQKKEGFEVSVPDEKPEIKILFSVEIKEETTEEDTTEEDTETETTDEEEEEIITEPVTPTEPVKPVELRVITKIICSDGTKVDKAEDCISTTKPPIKPNILIITVISIVIIGLGSIWNYQKNTELKGKYRWMPGMAGILRRKLEDYKLACKDGDNETATKLQGTLIKYSSTITKKYLDTLLKK